MYLVRSECTLRNFRNATTHGDSRLTAISDAGSTPAASTTAFSGCIQGPRDLRIIELLEDSRNIDRAHVVVVPGVIDKALGRASGKDRNPVADMGSACRSDCQKCGPPEA